MNEPAYQGQFDGLCGMYAIANALCHACGIDDEEDIFQNACSGLAHSRWPEVLWEGTTFKDMQNMLKYVQDCIDRDDLVVKYPFLKNIPKTNAEYWGRFDEIFFDQNVRCAIIGMKKPSLHWTVARSDGGRVYIMDSTADKLFDRKNRASIHAGNRLPSDKTWLLDRQEIIVFSIKDD